MDGIFTEICRTKGASADPKKLVHELIEEEAEKCLAGQAGQHLENKIVLAIAIRLKAERFMISQIADQAFVAGIDSNQVYSLVEKFKKRFPDARERIGILDLVALMTPENIHVNAFMYEPIIDMSDDRLRKLYGEVKGLQ